jgi:tRNA nucleotidyltransferase (CCA-adding enzyme)
MSEQGEQALERLSQLPGGHQVLQLAQEREDVALVGGAVRDLLLHGTPREIDLVLDGAPASFPNAAALFAHELASLLAAAGEDGEPQVSVHERFGTAAVCWSGGRVDVAARRAERYPHPGALPEVSPAGEREDLLRRDFTVNAIAVALHGSRRGTISAAPHALEDLAARQLRVLHSHSFEDDPTRLLRLGRYAARLRFTVEPGTAQLAAQAIEHGALAAVSASRIGAELRLVLSEPDLLPTLETLSSLRVLQALDPPLTLDADLLGRALRLLPADGRPHLLALAALFRPLVSEPHTLAESEAHDPRDRLLEALERFEYPAGERRPVVEAAMYAALLAEEIAIADCPSELWELLAGVAVEAVALAGAVAERGGDRQARAAAESWIDELRHVRLQISGEDLLRAGVPQGPEIGERLGEALRQRLDGMIEEGPQAELRAALEPHEWRQTMNGDQS